MFFIFTPIPGEMIQIDEEIFQLGWFNHHRVKQECMPSPPRKVDTNLSGCDVTALKLVLVFFEKATGKMRGKSSEKKTGGLILNLFLGGYHGLPQMLSEYFLSYLA